MTPFTKVATKRPRLL